MSWIFSHQKPSGGQFYKKLEMENKYVLDCAMILKEHATSRKTSNLSTNLERNSTFCRLFSTACDEDTELLREPTWNTNSKQVGSFWRNSEEERKNQKWGKPTFCTRTLGINWTNYKLKMQITTLLFISCFAEHIMRTINFTQVSFS